MMRLLPFVPVHTAAVVRAADATAQRQCALPGRRLMQAAAAAALEEARRRWPRAQSFAVICGPGNNGGDGYDFATLARAAGYSVAVHAAAAIENLRGDAWVACTDWMAAGGAVERGAGFDLAGADIVVDALFGTGLGRPLVGVWAAAVDAINGAGKPVLALDVPSGMDADTGAMLGCAVRATHTATFVGWKPGLFLAPGLAGSLSLHRLGIPASAFAADAVPLLREVPDAALADLPRRARDSHKGRHGHVLVVGGDHGMPGAVRLAAEAALRSGAGRVTVATRAEHAPLLPLACPELMAVGCEHPAELEARLATADVVVCGPGLGRGAWGRGMLEALLAGVGSRPLVLDADALRQLVELSPRELPPVSILTPHPGEAAALLACDTAAVQADRRRSVLAVARRWRAAVVLKGAATLVAGPEVEVPYVCAHGNPGMGTAGMGDVLAGICGGLAAQERCDPAWGYARGPERWVPLAALAVVAHATAGDAAALAGGERGLMASDLLPFLRAAVNGPGISP